MNIRRITRLLKLLKHLQSGSGHNADGLAKVCRVSRRTAFRDIEALRAAGAPIVYDGDRDRYSLPSAYFLPPINFSAAEALALLVLASNLGGTGGLPFCEPAHSAALKLESSLPPSLRQELTVMTRAIHILPAPVSALLHKRNIYQQIVEARAGRRVVRIEYESGLDRARITTKLRPYHLIFCRHSWYVIGRSSIHNAVRTFNLSRIDAIKPLAKGFSVPKSFNLESYLGNAWLLTPEPGPDHDVVIRFSPLVARNVADVKWHRTQQHKYEGDGSLVFRARVSGLNEIIWWILAYGDQAEVIHPERLRRLVNQRAQNMVALYEQCEHATATWERP